MSVLGGGGAPSGRGGSQDGGLRDGGPPGGGAGPDAPAQRRYTPDFVTDLFRNPLDPGYAEAARRRAERGEPSRRSRLSARVARTVVLVLAGGLLAVAYHQTVASTPESDQIQSSLVGDVRSRQAETDAMQKQADELRDQVSKLRDDALGDGDSGALQTLEAMTGVIKVRGDGAVVRLTDAPPQIDPVSGQQTENLGKVQDRDLQSVCNELWRDGAEAIAINGERLTATSTVRTAGETILVDFRPITSPYQVVAIGPDDLQKRFDGSSTGELFRELATDYHMQVSVKSQNDLTVAAAADPQLHYAKPLTSATASTPSTAANRTSGSPDPSPSGGR
ncbi:DUF881 domain-containing protein [Rugosimonospora acidiphila]|uniref:DUF881 domain-containing protein n=1 Tax=Rugosimonospora acidiphila TaxID=556531 RepID=A0ABP9RLZ5_9ACTN